MKVKRIQHFKVKITFYCVIIDTENTSNLHNQCKEIKLVDGNTFVCERIRLWVFEIQHY